MPRITQMHLKTEQSLVAIKGMKSFKNDIIKPANIVDEELITSEWDEIQRILASIARKDVSQSTIIKKLSSYSRKNKTLKALIEFDRIIMSIYMLRYIDDLQLRKNVHRALNGSVNILWSFDHYKKNNLNFTKYTSFLYVF